MRFVPTISICRAGRPHSASLVKLLNIFFRAYWRLVGSLL